MSDVLLAEFRHRFNQRISERRRRGFPKLGHFDTWLVDSLQLIVERNHNAVLFEFWSNTSDFIDTPERLGTVCLHTPILAGVIESIELEPLADGKPHTLRPDQHYICKTMGTKLPLLPVHGEAECRVFSELMRNAPEGEPDFDQMAIDWFVPPSPFQCPSMLITLAAMTAIMSPHHRCAHVDGVEIFPKLPVYLRTHCTSWQRNRRVRDAVTKAMPGAAKLRELNRGTARAAGLVATSHTAAHTATLEPSPAAGPAASPAAAPAATPATSPAAGLDAGLAASLTDAPTGDPAASATAGLAPALVTALRAGWRPPPPPPPPSPPLPLPWTLVAVNQHPFLPLAPSMMAPAHPVIVAGSIIGGAPAAEPPLKKRRGRDKHPGARVRHCGHCGESNCIGTRNRKECRNPAKK